MKYTIEMGWGTIIYRYVPSSIKIGSDSKVAGGRDEYTDREMISKPTLIFPE
jgi:hypothetical protein